MKRSNGARTAAVILICAVAGIAARDALDSARDRLGDATPNERKRLAALFAEYRGMTPQERQRIEQLAAVIDQKSNRAELEIALDRLLRWVDTLSPPERSDFFAADTVEKRLQVAHDILRRQKHDLDRDMKSFEEMAASASKRGNDRPRFDMSRILLPLTEKKEVLDEIRRVEQELRPKLSQQEKEILAVPNLGVKTGQAEHSILIAALSRIDPHRVPLEQEVEAVCLGAARRLILFNRGAAETQYPSLSNTEKDDFARFIVDVYSLPPPPSDVGQKKGLKGVRQGGGLGLLQQLNAISYWAANTEKLTFRQKVALNRIETYLKPFARRGMLGFPGKNAGSRPE